MRRASWDLPAPVGPQSSSGAVERIATCSIRSIVALNVAERVAMPDLRKDVASRASTRNRWAMRS